MGMSTMTGRGIPDEILLLAWQLLMRLGLYKAPRRAHSLLLPTEDPKMRLRSWFLLLLSSRSSMLRGKARTSF